MRIICGSQKVSPRFGSQNRNFGIKVKSLFRHFDGARSPARNVSSKMDTTLNITAAPAPVTVTCVPDFTLLSRSLRVGSSQATVIGVPNLDVKFFFHDGIFPTCNALTTAFCCLLLCFIHRIILLTIQKIYLICSWKNLMKKKLS